MANAACPEVSFAGVAMKNPVVLASGTCGFGRELGGYFDISRLDSIASKGLTLNPRRILTRRCSILVIRSLRDALASR